MIEPTAKRYFADVQAGYSKGRSQSITNSYKKQHCTIGLFLDVKATFDAVWKIQNQKNWTNKADGESSLLIFEQQNALDFYELYVV